MAIFLGKNYLGQSDTHVLEQTPLGDFTIVIAGDDEEAL